MKEISNIKKYFLKLLLLSSGCSSRCCPLIRLVYYKYRTHSQGGLDFAGRDAILALNALLPTGLALEISAKRRNDKVPAVSSSWVYLGNIEAFTAGFCCAAYWLVPCL